IARRFTSDLGVKCAAVEVRSSDGFRLRGWWIAPNPPTRTAVILLHGVADTRQGMLGHARLLLKNGYSVLMPDSRGHGISEGDRITYGLKEADDIRIWADWLRTHGRSELAIRPRRLDGRGEPAPVANHRDPLQGCRGRMPLRHVRRRGLLPAVPCIRPRT